jgi:TetR/AcrR family transcriptional repressor of bet genes
MPRPSNTDERRAQIVHGLIAVMAKHGYDGASIADVAKRAGLAPGLVHYHFKNKLEILIEVVRALAAGHTTAVDAALANVDEPTAQLQAFIDVHLGTGQHANPAALACWVIVTAEAVRQPRIHREVERVLGEMADRLTAIITRGQAAKQFGAVDARAAAAALLATIQGYFVLAATAREVIPAGSAATATQHMAWGLLNPTRGGRA